MPSGNSQRSVMKNPKDLVGLMKKCAKRNWPQSLLISFKRLVSAQLRSGKTKALKCSDKVSTSSRMPSVKVALESTTQIATFTLLVGQPIGRPGQFLNLNSTTPEGHSNLPGTTTTGDSPTFSTKMTTTQD